MLRAWPIIWPRTRSDQVADNLLVVLRRLLIVVQALLPRVRAQLKIEVPLLFVPSSPRFPPIRRRCHRRRRMHVRAMHLAGRMAQPRRLLVEGVLYERMNRG